MSLWFPAATIALAGMMGTATVGSEQRSPTSKFYRIVDGKVDARTYNGFRRYNAACNHCHGPGGAGSTFAPSLIDKLLDVDAFRHVVLDGAANGTSNMKGSSGDPNVVLSLLKNPSDHRANVLFNRSVHDNIARAQPHPDRPR
jgi:mono/diheme cytochrome c family protein